MKILPLFKSHYSIGKSILTLDKAGSSSKEGSSSIVDIVKENKLDPSKTEIKHSSLKSEPTESSEEIEKRIFKPDDKLYEYKNSNSSQSSI